MKQPARASPPHDFKNRTTLFFGIAAIAVAAVSTYIAFSDDPQPQVASAAQRSENIQDRFDLMGAQLKAMSEQAAAQGVAKNDGVLMYASLNPAQFVLTAKSFGGHPAYGEAMLRIGCANYFKSRDNHVNDLAAATTMQRSGSPGTEQLPAELLFRMRTQEIQCQHLTPDMLAQSDALMREAAAAGDVSAQTIVLRERSHQVLNELWTQTQSGAASEALMADAKTMLGEAATLAKKGNQQAALLAAQLTAIDTLGQKDVEASATWNLVGVQGHNEPFNPDLFAFESEPYSQLSAPQRNAAIARARLRYESCCMNTVVPKQAS